MATATAAQTNGDNENILRSRMVKPPNPQVVRTMSEEGLLKDLGPLPKFQTDENGGVTANTR